MNTYLLKTSRGYAKLQGNVRIISSTMQWLKKKFSQQMKDVLEKFWWHLTHQFLLKILAQENLSVNLQRYWISNIRLLFVGLVQLRHSMTQSKNTMCCGQTLQSTIVIKKWTKRLEKPLTTGFYIILSLWYLQLKTVVCMHILMATPKRLIP